MFYMYAMKKSAGEKGVEIDTSFEPVVFADREDLVRFLAVTTVTRGRREKEMWVNPILEKLSMSDGEYCSKDARGMRADDVSCDIPALKTEGITGFKKIDEYASHYSPAYARYVVNGHIRRICTGGRNFRFVSDGKVFDPRDLKKDVEKLVAAWQFKKAPAPADDEISDWTAYRKKAGKKKVRQGRKSHTSMYRKSAGWKSGKDRKQWEHKVRMAFGRSDGFGREYAPCMRMEA